MITPYCWVVDIGIGLHTGFKSPLFVNEKVKSLTEKLMIERHYYNA